MGDISKITANGSTYNVKDTTAREMLENVPTDAFNTDANGYVNAPGNLTANKYYLTNTNTWSDIGNAKPTYTSSDITEGSSAADTWISIGKMSNTLSFSTLMQNLTKMNANLKYLYRRLTVFNGSGSSATQWQYLKLKNGLFIGWRIYKSDATTVTAQWGGCYASGIANFQAIYPVTFKYQPYVLITPILMGINGNNFWIATHSHSTNVLTQSDYYQVCRGSQATNTQSYYVSVLVIGYT